MIVHGVDRPLSTPALYYPYTDFQSEAWAKLALLNWSRIERIKPSSYPIEDRAATQRLFDLDWLQDIAPNPYQLRMVTDQFEEILSHFGQHLQAKYAVDQRDSWPKHILALHRQVPMNALPTYTHRTGWKSTK